jgi:hypothetical protein
MAAGKDSLGLTAGIGVVCLMASLSAASDSMESVALPPVLLGDAPMLPFFLESTADPKSPGGAPSATTDGGFVVDIDHRQQVRAFFNSVYAGTENNASNWSGDVAACDAGSSSQAFKDNVVARVNFFRAMAGAPADLVIDNGASGKAQEAALIMSANNNLSHAPPLSWVCWSPDGDEAAGNSNLSLGSYGSDAVSGYMGDNGSNNAAVGHRRWILYPQTQWLGTGDIPPSSGSSSTNALWVFDGHFSDPRPAVRDGFVAWPPPGYVPYNIVYPRWSISYPGADFSGALVSMMSEGQSVPVQEEVLANGFGENTLVWVAGGLDPTVYNEQWPQPIADTSYQVNVSNVLIGGVATDFSYVVNIFDPETAVADEEQPTISGSSLVPAGALADFQFDPVSFADTHEVLTATATTYSAVLDAETPTADIVDLTSAAYDLRDDQVAYAGSYSFHLAHPSPKLEFFEIDGSFYVGQTGMVRFFSRLGWASTTQLARLDVSLDDGNSWIGVYSQYGFNNAGEGFFTLREIDLSAYAGKTLRLRFAYDHEGGSFFPQTSSGVGFYVDELELIGLSKLSGEVIETVTGSNRFQFSAGTSGTYLLQARALPWAGFPGLEWSEVFEVSVSDLVSWIRSDFDGDGKSDIVLRNMDTGFVFMWQMDGNLRTYHSIGPLPLDREVLGIADLSGDGIADIVLRNADNGFVYMWEMNGNLRTYHSIGPLPLNREVVGIADLTADGKADLVLRNTATGFVYLWEMDGNLKTYHSIGSLALNREIVGVADLTGDGKADLVLRNTATGFVYLWEMDGNLKTYHSIGSLALNRSVVQIADLSGDGKADIVLRNMDTGFLYMWEMDGNLKEYHGIGSLDLVKEIQPPVVDGGT